MNHTEQVAVLAAKAKDALAGVILAIDNQAEEMTKLRTALTLAQGQAELMRSDATSAREEYHIALTLLTESAGGDRGHWNHVVAARRQEKTIMTELAAYRSDQEKQ